MAIGKVLFKIAKGRFIGNTVGLGFQYFSFAIPVKKVFNSQKVLGFFHPKPSYKEHMVFVPKKAISNLIELAKDNNVLYFLDIWHSTQEVAKQRWGEKCMYVLCANGGKRQEVQQVHFHLFKEHKIVNEYKMDKQIKCAYSDGYIGIIEHPNPNWQIHFVVIPMLSENSEEKVKQLDINNFLIKVINCITVVDSKYDIIKNGYTIVYQNDSSDKQMKIPVFHIVSGKKIK